METLRAFLGATFLAAAGLSALAGAIGMSALPAMVAEVGGSIAAGILALVWMQAKSHQGN